jgi:hypothetical protein
MRLIGRLGAARQPINLGLSVCFSLLTAFVTAAAAASGPILPAQTNRTIDELTTLLVTNTATDNSVPAGQSSTNVINFNYANRTAFVNDDWGFWAIPPGGAGRNTEITDTSVGPLISYDQVGHPGVLRIPCDVGDLWAGTNNSRNSLFRTLATNWTSMSLALSFAPTMNYQQVHLALYQDDDNYVQAGFAYNTAINGANGLATTLIWEYGGVPNHFVQALSPVTSIRLRLDHDLATGNISQLYSLDGTTWNFLGTTSQALVNPRLCIWVGGSPVPWVNGMANCDLQQLQVVTGTVGLALTYQLLAPPPGATIDTNGVITWTPSETQGPGTNVITTVVTDNAQPPLSATNSFTVVVNEVNTPPVLPAQTNQTVRALATLVVTNTATDSDLPANPLTYQLQTAPTNAVMDTNGVITFIPVMGQALSTNLFVTVVTDYNPWAVNAQHLSATNTFAVTVLPPAGLFLPVQTNQVVNELTALVVTNMAMDGSPSVPQTGTNTVLFNYTDRASLLADGWSFIGTNSLNPTRNTETTTGAGVVDYNQAAHPGVLRLPCDLGDLWGTQNNTRNSLFRSLPTDWKSVRLVLTFAPVTANYQQAHLGLYQDDDNYLQMGVAYNTYDGNERFTMDSEIGGITTTFAKAPTTNTNLSFRLDWNPTNSVVTGYYSFDGTNWTLLGSTNMTLANPRLMIWAGGSTAAYADGMAVMDVRRLDVVAGTTVPTVLSYSVLNPPAGLTISSNGVITWTPTEAQGPASGTITTVVTDNGLPPLSATNSFVVVVNEINTPPVLPVQTDRTLTGQQALLVTNTASDSDIPMNTLSYQLIGAPGAAIDPNGVITWTPTLAQVPGTNVFTTVVTDYNPWAVNEQHLSATNSFRVVVNAIHNGPTLPAQTNLTIAELTTLTLTNTALDTDLPVLALTYSLLNPPAGLTISGNGVITWTPSEAQGPGTNTITTVMTDNGAPPLSATNSFVVVVNEINTPPVLPVQGDRTVAGQRALLVINTATDADIPTNSLSYQLIGAPAGAAIDTNGVITWTPTLAQQPSTNIFTTVVTDYNPWAVNAQHLSATNSFRVVVNAIHNGPTLPAQTNLTIAELTTLVLTNTAIDSDMPILALTYSLVNPPAGLTISSNGVMTWTPSEAQGPGTNTITTVVTDNGVPPLSATNSFVVVVDEINTPPVLPVQTDRTLMGQQALLVTNTASDADIPTNSLSYQLNGAPADAAIDANGVITWTPTLAQMPSTNIFTTIVTDYNPWAVNAQHLSATNSFRVVVNTIHNGPTLPAQANLTIAELTTLSLTNTAIDSDLPALALTYSLVNPPSGLTISSNGIITWTPSEAQGPGTNTVTTVVTDNGAPPLSATNSIIVVVNEINTPPVLPVQTDRTLTGQQALLVTNAASDADIPANSLSYQLTGAPTGAAIDTNGVITWTPSVAQVPSTNVFTTVVTDYNPWAVNAQHLSATNGFRVVVNAVHNGPALPAQPNTTIAELTTLTVTNAAIDTDFPPVTLKYGLVYAPAGAMIDGNGVISWTPTEAQGPSTNTFTTLVYDNGTPILSAVNTFEVVVSEINVPPVLPVQTARELVGQQELVVTNTASDSDIPTNSLSYQLSTAPAGAVIDTNGVITWTPSLAQVPGTNVFITVVTDYNPWAINAQHQSATNSFSVVVNAIHNGPSLPAQTDLTIAEMTTLTLTNTAIDADLPLPTILTYSLLAAPANAVIDTNGVIRWTPTSAQAPSTNVFVTTVTDDLVPHLSATNSFIVIVDRLPDVPPPVIQAVIISNGTATVTWSATAGRTYRLQYKNGFQPTNWLDLSPDILANAPTASFTETNLAVSERFYRVQMLP